MRTIENGWQLIDASGKSYRGAYKIIPAMKFFGVTIRREKRVWNDEASVEVTLENVKDDDEWVWRRFTYKAGLIAATHVYGEWKTPQFVLMLTGHPNCILETEQISFSFDPSISSPVAKLDIRGQGTMHGRLGMIKVHGATLVFKDEAHIKSVVSTMVMKEKPDGSREAVVQQGDSCLVPFIAGAVVGGILF